MKFKKIVFYKSINRLLFSIILLTAFAFSFKIKNQIVNQEGKPNVIIIITDDQGYADVGFNGCKDIPTPNIDQIAKNGVVFRNAYVSYSVCAPSRAGLLTGRYQDRFGYSRNPLYRPFDDQIGVSLNEQMLPDYLLQFGYSTMAIGKWHLGVHEKFRPWNRGFKEFFGFLGGGHRYFPEEYIIANQDEAKNEEQSYKTKLIRNQTAVEESEYITDAFSREAVSFIDRNKKQSFFLYLAFNAPHAPLQATQKYLDRFKNIEDPKRRTYAAMVSAVDDGVGLILHKLEQLNIDENTIIIFLSDNGGPQKDNASKNDPLSGGKGSLFEGGIRVPFAMQWPKHIKPNTEFNQSIISLDIFATVAANIQSTAKPKNELDGVNILPYINGTKTGAPHEFLFWRHFDQKNYAVLHKSGLKEIILKDSNINIYNLKKEISEKTNVIEKNNQMFLMMEMERKKWESKTIPPAFLGLMQEEQYNKEKRKNR